MGSFHGFPSIEGDILKGKLNCIHISITGEVKAYIDSWFWSKQRVQTNFALCTHVTTITSAALQIKSREMSNWEEDIVIKFATTISTMTVQKITHIER